MLINSVSDKPVPRMPIVSRAPRASDSNYPWRRPIDVLIPDFDKFMRRPRHDAETPGADSSPICLRRVIRSAIYPHPRQAPGKLAIRAGYLARRKGVRVPAALRLACWARGHTFAASGG